MLAIQPLRSEKASSLKGSAAIPGDKSISHRALMFGGIAQGETIISGLLEGEDVLATAMAMRAMGARISKGEDGLWRCFGTGLGYLQEPDDVLYMGNSGTSTRLLAGLIAGHSLYAVMSGDKSLRKRPMQRIIDPLVQMGANFWSRPNGRLPLSITGTSAIKGIEYRLPVASAQVKSSILLAGLSAEADVTVIEQTPTRDHTENMLSAFSVPVQVSPLGEGGMAITLSEHRSLLGCAIDVPADPSSAAFPLVAALLVEGSEILLPRVCLNPRRAGLYETLIEMGADLRFENERIETGERVADLRIKGTGPLQAIEVPPSRVASMIDEIPILAMVAACANGVTKMTGLDELRVKESDRLAVTARGLSDCGVRIEEGENSLLIHGNGMPPLGGAVISTHLDHRIAMSFLVLGAVTQEAVQIDDASPIRTSFPTFIELMNDLGCVLTDV